jgi:predicted amidohydrolase YtcJ
MWDFYENDSDFTIPKGRLKRNKQIHVGGLKLIGDGSVSGRTAWMEKPYLGSDRDYGMPVYSDESMESAIEFVKKNHCQLAVHAMGGKAIDRVVDRLYDEENWMEGSVPMVRMEHITEPSEDAVKRAAEKGIYFVTQPIFAYCEIETYLKNLGLERTKKTYPVKHLLDSGVKLALSTDSPATSWAVPSDPFSNIKSAVTRIAYDGTDLGQDQRIDMETAIRLYTACGAEAAGFERAGILKEGYLADFIVLDRDIFSEDPMSIDETKVLQTYINGEMVYSRG